MQNQELQGVLDWGEGQALHHLTLKYLVFKSLSICSLDLRSLSEFV